MRGVGTIDPPEDLLVQSAESALEAKRKYEDNKLLFYKPCCLTHATWLEDKASPTGKRMVNICPINPCPESSHLKFHQSDKKVRIVLGSNKAGKTTMGLTELLMMACLKNHPYRKTMNQVPGYWRIYGPDFSLVEKKMIPSVREWIPKSCLLGEGATKREAWDNSFDNKYHILNLKSGGQIDFMSYDQPSSKSESVDLDGVFGDEEMPEDIYSACMARLIARKGRFWLTVTPLYQFSWGMKFLDSIDPDIQVFNFDILQNPYIDAESRDSFADKVPEHEKDARLKGQFMELQGLVYKEIKSDIHLVDHSEPKSQYPLIFTMDPHPRKPTVATWSYVTEKDDVVFFDELEMRGTAREIVAAIRSKESQFKGKVQLRLIDPAARGQGSNLTYETDTLREFQREGMDFTLADNSEAGYNVVHEYLGFDVSRPMSSLNRPKCFFTKNVQKTWYGMTHLLWDEWSFRSTMKDEKERVKDYKKDFPDCVKYTLAYRPTWRNLKIQSSTPIGNLQDMMEFEKQSFLREHFLNKVA